MSTQSHGRTRISPATPLKWGTWGPEDFCPNNGLVSGFEQRWEPPKRGDFRIAGEKIGLGDLKMGTAGIHLKCKETGRIITSKEARFKRTAKKLNLLESPPNSVFFFFCFRDLRLRMSTKWWNAGKRRKSGRYILFTTTCLLLQYAYSSGVLLRYVPYVDSVQPNGNFASNPGVTDVLMKCTDGSVLQSTLIPSDQRDDGIFESAALSPLRKI